MTVCSLPPIARNQCCPSILRGHCSNLARRKRVLREWRKDEHQSLFPQWARLAPSCPEPAKIRARFIGRAPTGWQSAPGVAGDKSVERVRTPSDRWAPASARHAGHAKGAQTGRAVVGRVRPGRDGIFCGRCRQCGQEHEPCALGEHGHHRPATTGLGNRRVEQSSRRCSLLALVP